MGRYLLWRSPLNADYSNMANRVPAIKRCFYILVFLFFGMMMIGAHEPAATPAAVQGHLATQTAGPLPSENFRSFEKIESELPAAIVIDSVGRRHSPQLSFSLDASALAAVQLVLAEFAHPSRLPSFLRSYQRNYLFRTKIFEELSARSLPPEIFYIAFIESEFTVDARSTSGALGLWQFMENSMAPWMSKNSYKDERLSFYAATEAAILKLEENYRALDDWLLAFAAYNAGLGAVRRAVAANGSHDFWTLAQLRAIPDQSIRYVHKVLAAALLGQELGRLGGVQPWYDTSRWVRILVPGGIPLSFFSNWTGLPEAFLELSNAHLLESRTPPNERFHPITLPQKYLKQLQNSSPTLQYAVGQGETLWGIAQKFATSVETLRKLNNLDGNSIQSDEVINIPLVFSEY